MKTDSEKCIGNGSVVHREKLENRPSVLSLKSKTLKEEIDKSLLNIDFEGIDKLRNAKTTFFRIFWTLMLLGGFIIAMYEIIQTILSYQNSPIVTSYRIITNDSMEFPQIYLCPSNKVRQSYLQVNRSHFERAQQLANVLFVDNKPKKNPFNVSLKNGDFPEDQTTFEYFKRIYMDMSISQADFFVLCQFRSYFLLQPLCATLVTPVVDPYYGKCYVIDVGQLQQQVPAQGLTIVLNTKTQEYPSDPELQPKFEGLLASVAKKFDPGSTFETVLIPQHTYAKVSITAQYMKFDKIESGPGKRLCNEPDEFEFKVLNVPYSVSACKRECYYQTVLEKCRCVMPMDQLFLNPTLLNTSFYCTADKIASCVRNDVIESFVAQTKISECTNSCRIPCKSWRFDTLSSDMPLFDPSFENLKLPNDSSPYDYTYVQFAFPNLEYEEFAEEGKSFSFTDMIGNIGGQAGLWMGISVIGLIKIPVALFTLCYYYAYRIFTVQRKKVRPFSHLSKIVS